MTVADLRDKILDQNVELTLANGKTITGSLEYFPTGKTLVVMDEDGLEPFILTVPEKDAPEETAALEPGQALMRDWTEVRGAASALVEQGRIELTGEMRQIGLFRLSAYIARVL